MNSTHALPTPPATARSSLRNWVLWMATFLAFPVGGLPAIALGGVDDTGTALAGGVAAGLVVGAAQWLVLRRIVPGASVAWVPATAAGLALGLAAGSAVVGYSTGAVELVVEGAFSGLGVGLAQASVLRPRLGSAAAAMWAGVAIASWPLGWTVTRAFGIAVENRFAVFGATGAIAFTAVSGLVLFALTRRNRLGGILMSELRVVLGATGGVGTALARELVSRGLLTRAVSRRGTAVPGAEAFPADITDPAALRAATAGAAVVYHAAQPAYTRWPQEFPALTRGVVDAAAAARATLVMVDNLYLYGPVPGGYGPGTAAGPMTERTPVTATGRKGRVRAAMATELLNTHRSGRLPVVIARLADYYGPGGLSSSVGAQLFGGALTGKAATWLGSADHVHSFTYLPDAARALATLGEEPAAAGGVFHLPNAAPVTPRQFVRLVHDTAGVEHRLRVVPAWVVGAAGLVVPLARELAELRYQVQYPFVADHTAFEVAFGPFDPTPHEVAVAETLRWFADRRATATAPGPSGL